MADIKVNFINRSNDSNKSSILVFQKNVATSYDSLAIAWKVIKNCGTGWQHPFVFPMEFQVSANDSYGNQVIKPLAATNGQSFQVYSSVSGDAFGLLGAAIASTDVEIKNNLSTGSIDACIYRGGKIIARKTGISPGQKGAFQFLPTIWVGISSQIEEGDVINSAIISDINQSFSLLGFVSVDLVLTGGGTGTQATAFKFSLENMVQG